MISLQDLYKNLGGKQIMNGTTLQINAGETQVILGRSGEGKSVLLKHICGLMRPDSGKVYVDNEEISQYSDRELVPVRRKIGLLFQNSALFDSLNILENVGFALIEQKKPLEEVKERAVDTLKKVRLKEEVLYKMPSELSGGMRKRVSLARAIIQKPVILLYDEPTTGLDPITSDAINDLIIELSEDEKMTSFVITHDMTTVFKVATRISMLFEGKIIYNGTPEETRNTDNEIIQQFVQGKAEGPLSNL